MMVGPGCKKRLWKLFAAGLVLFLTGCIDEGKVNTDSATYTPEERPLGVIAGDGAEYAPGTTVTLSGRLVGTVTDQTVLWTQTAGPAVEADDWTEPALTFMAPTVEGIANLSFQIAALDASGNVINDADGEPLVDEVTIAVFDPAALLVFEIEDTSVATLNAVAAVSEGNAAYINGASGGSHTADITPGASVVFNLTMGAADAGFYTLYVGYAIPSDYGGKVGQVQVNGVPSDMDFGATGNWENYRVGIVKLEEGANVIEVGGGWNYYRIDNISLIPAAKPAGPLPVAASLVNPAATPEALSLMEFLTGHYGSATVSGQTEFPTRGSGSQFELFEFNKVVAATGDDAPAIVAFDFMEFSASRVANGSDPAGLSEDMIAAHQELNVILSALWHWNAPSALLDTDEFPWYQGFYTTNTTFDLAAALADTSSDEYQQLLTDIDTVSAELKKFADAGIPILWRPLHEAEGAWFWWGAAGPDALKSLWHLMYDRMTNMHQLNNLIWVYTHAGNLDADWYPGDAYVDIVGYDGYDGNNASNPFASQYSTLKDRFDGKKLVALTETGTIPSVEQMHASDAWWSFFITWNSGDVYGPDGIDAATIDTNYGFDGVVNLADVPGGRTKVEAGIMESFEFDTAGWGAQVNWSDTDGLRVSDSWAQSGSMALSVTKDMSAIDAPENVVLQAYPAAGLDVSNAVQLTIYANAVNAGTPNVHVFVKHADGELWPDPVDVTAGGVAYSVDVDGIDMLTGLGVRFQNLDASATAAEYLIDQVTLTDAEGNETVVYDFEPDPSAWAAQLAWSNTAGITTSTDWSATGKRSLALYKDLIAAGASSDVVLQVYPEGGIDVAGKSTLTIAAQATGAGSSVDAHIFFKAPDGVESWPTAVAVTDSGVVLSIDVSGVDKLDGLGVRFNGVAASDDARFYIDSVQVDGATLYDFEGTGNWEFQVNWSPVAGIHLADDWASHGSNSLAGMTQLMDGDDNIILQTYPAGGLLLGDVSTLKVAASTVDAGAGVQVQLWAKDKEGTWRDSGAVDLDPMGSELTLDISDLDELQGFGVRFMGAVNSASESGYYLDQVEFLP